MLLAVLIIPYLFNDIQAIYPNDTNPVLHTIHKRHENEQNDSSEMFIQKYEKERPEELKACKICGLINSVEEMHQHDGMRKMIIGGNAVKPPYKYPWMVALKNGKEPICGAAIVSDTYILTASHCISKFDDAGGQFERFYRPDELTVAFLTKTEILDAGPPIEKLFHHPEWHPDEMNYDVALIKLSQKITCGTFRNPICLPGPSTFTELTADKAKNIAFQITGWGVIKAVPTKEFGRQLKEAKVRMVDFSECRPHMKTDVEKSGYCFRAVENDRPCFGDSGGSLFFPYNGSYVSAGVASLHTCQKCSAEMPFVYSSIPKAMPWINKIMDA